MIRGARPYLETKTSGVLGIGDIPEHWQLRRLRSVAELRVSSIDKHVVDGEEPVRLCNYVDVYKNDVIHSRMSFMRGTATTSEIMRFRLQAGDVLITKDSETWDDIGVPALVTESAHDLVSGYHLALLRPTSELDGAYLFRTLQSNGIAYQFHIEANGVTRYGLAHSAIKAVTIPIPPRNEQTAIVQFLDHADRKIRRYIRAKQKLIALLEDQKHAIIHRAVTRGLDPNVRLKPSGIEWLGDVPNHWDVKAVSRVVTDGPKNGVSPEVSETGGIRSFSLSALRHGFLNVKREDTKFVKGGVDLLRGYSLKLGDVVLVRGNGNIRLVGRTAVVLQDMPDWIYPDLIMRMRCGPACLPPFLSALINCPVGRAQIESAARTTVGTFKVNNQQIRRLVFAFPPPIEQARILAYLTTALRPTLGVQKRSEREISLLRELRTRLIADIVTGKLDVREAASRLLDAPLEADEGADDVSPADEAPEDLPAEEDLE